MRFFWIFILPFLAYAEEDPARVLRDKVADLQGQQQAHTSSLNEKRAKEEREWVRKLKALSEKAEILEKVRSAKLKDYHLELRDLQTRFSRQLRLNQELREKIPAENKLDLAENLSNFDYLSKLYIQETRKLTDKHNRELEAIDNEFTESLEKTNNHYRELYSSSTNLLNKIQSDRKSHETRIANELSKELGLEERKGFSFSDYAREKGDPAFRKGPQYLEKGMKSLAVTGGAIIVVDGVALSSPSAAHDAYTNINDLKYDPSITAEIVDKKIKLKFKGKPLTLDFVDNTPSQKSLKMTNPEAEYYLQQRFLARLVDTWGVENLVEHEKERLKFTLTELTNLQPCDDPQVIAYVNAIQKGRGDLIQEYRKKYGLSYTKDFTLIDDEGEYFVHWAVKSDDIQQKWKAQLQKLFNPPAMSPELIASLQAVYVPPPELMGSTIVTKKGCEYFRLSIEKETLRVDVHEKDAWMPLFRTERFQENNQITCIDKSSIAVVGTSLTNIGDLKFDLLKDGFFNADVIEDEKSLSSRDKDKTVLFIIKDKKVTRALSPIKGQFEGVDHSEHIVGQTNYGVMYRAVPGKRIDKKMSEWNFEGTIYISPTGKTIMQPQQ